MHSHGKHREISAILLCDHTSSVFLCYRPRHCCHGRQTPRIQHSIQDCLSITLHTSLNPINVRSASVEWNCDREQSLLLAAHVKAPVSFFSYAACMAMVSSPLGHPLNEQLHTLSGTCLALRPSDIVGICHEVVQPCMQSTKP